MRLAALYVMPGSIYEQVPWIDCWGKDRDARLYAGPYPVIAHPPCERWGRYWFGGPSAKVRKVKGDDDGCFKAALASVRQFGGVLEHPAATSAWVHFGLQKPPRAGGWVRADEYGWTCCVDQGHYGHRAQKATWLYYVGTFLPELKWGKSESAVRFEDGYHSAEERARKRKIKTGICQRLSKKQRLQTPGPFRDALIRLVLGHE